MQGLIAHPFSAIAGAAAGVTLLLAYAPPDDRPLSGFACSVVSSAAIQAAAGRPLRLAPTDGYVCRYFGTNSDLEIAASVVSVAPALPFGSNAASVDLPDGGAFVVRVRDGSPGADAEGMAVRIADLAASQQTADAP